MTLQNLPKMFYSYSEGWPDLMRMHPSVMRMLTFYVLPMSLIPAAMFVYSIFVTPGAVFPEVVPAFSGGEAATLFVAFVAVQLLMVALMASIIQQMGNVAGAQPSYHDAFMLAAVAPTPLWLGALVLFIPSMWAAITAMAVAWVGSAALIYHGVEPLFNLQGHDRARLMGSFVLAAGVVAWCALMVVLALMMSMIIGLR
ncbi:MAG: YIP1 family protein [Thauera phenolivorans]|uniref:YIP1 family protein n=1 Tax=Thauera phenolivorans TaxID=1792543 RepID=A0A7X7LX61_9RHOO|nr:Yip1 family protein [Thauera phenolivorans]NLF55051.1 YIP1 family protein [Thauera phenolivorans]